MKNSLCWLMMVILLLGIMGGCQSVPTEQTSRYPLPNSEIGKDFTRYVDNVEGNTVVCYVYKAFGQDNSSISCLLLGGAK